MHHATSMFMFLPFTCPHAHECRYTYSLQSLSHALLLAPQNPFYFLKAAETAYTAGDVTLALKYFLITVDMTDDTGDKPAKDTVPTGITLRAWYGVELVGQCTHHGSTPV